MRSCRIAPEELLVRTSRPEPDQARGRGSHELMRFAAIRQPAFPFRALALALAILATASGAGAAVSALSPGRFAIHVDGFVLHVPFKSSHLLIPNAAVRRAIIVIHGSARNSNNAFEDVNAAVELRPTESKHTLIVAPQLLL
ncbi:MAG: hypothetical protein ACYTFI_12430, partial [Planctomycetota bacterium]